MKIPEPRRLSNGDWYIYLRLNGKGIPVQDSNKATCKAKAASIKAQYKAGELEIKPPKGKGSTKTLAEIMQAYIDHHGAALSPATVRGYTMIRKNRFRAYHDTPVDSITDWQKLVNDEIPLCSAKTLANAFALLKRALRIEAGIRIPLETLNLPQVPVKEIPWLRPKEIAPFCEAIQGRTAEIPALIELHGLRASEAEALSWDTKDIDLENGIIHVRKARVRGVDGYVEKDTNKNRSSTRDVPIMIPRLKEILEAEPNKTGLVIKRAHNTTYANIKRACERAKVTVVGNHGLRHSFASLGYRAGLSERQLMDLGGWSDRETMHKIYIRLSKEDYTEAVEKMRQAFQNS